jgi:predicted O-methyltransferase YrrM
VRTNGKGDSAKPSRLSQKYIAAKAWESYLKLMVHPPNSLAEIPGYLHPLEARFLYWLAGRVPKNGLALEVGSYKGKSTAHLASGLQPTARLACVDTWRNDAMPYDAVSDVLPEFLRNVDVYRNVIETHRGFSAEVASNWSLPLDLLFIDGDHSYEGCSSDLSAWLKFVRPSGWVVFHDSSEPGVAQAIAEQFPRTNRSMGLNAWSIFAARKLK